MENQTEADAAMAHLDNYDLKGRKIHVEVSVHEFDELNG